jgi:hypothetical protein
VTTDTDADPRGALLALAMVEAGIRLDLDTLDYLAAAAIAEEDPNLVVARLAGMFAGELIDLCGLHARCRTEAIRREFLQDITNRPNDTA